jgi:DNA-binding response OmpR family regulator
MGTTILVVEDEVKIRELLRSYLEREGFDVVSTGSGADAIGLAQTAAPDLVILDLRLPDVRGESVASEIRRFSEVPVLMLTAKAAEQDRIHGLELGADDYVTKPFSPRELVLRAKAILRRGQPASTGSGPALFGGGELAIDEWGVLLALTRTPGRVYSRYELINRVRGYEFEGYERTIDSHVKNLRRKIERDPRNPRVIETVLGVGYRLGLPPDA